MSAIKQEKLKQNVFRQRSFRVVRGLFELQRGPFEVIFGILRYPCVLMGGIFKDLYDGIQISSGRVFSGSPTYDSLSWISQSFWYFFDHQWSERSCFKKIIQNFFSSRKVTFGHFFEKIFCPRWQVENSTLTLKFWALRSKMVKRSFRARITLVMSHGRPYWLKTFTVKSFKAVHFWPQRQFHFFI